MKPHSKKAAQDSMPDQSGNEVVHILKADRQFFDIANHYFSRTGIDTETESERNQEFASNYY